MKVKMMIIMNPQTVLNIHNWRCSFLFNDVYITYLLNLNVLINLIQLNYDQSIGD